MEFPKLRALEFFLVPVSGRKMIGLRDPMNFSSDVMAVPQELYLLLTLLDGLHSPIDIQAEYMRQHGELIYKETIEEIVEKLDAGYFLDNERFRQKRSEIVEGFKSLEIRPAILAGKSYGDSPTVLADQIETFFAHSDGPGSIDRTKADTTLKGIIAPHIDFERGGPCFAWAYKRLREQTDADVFVVFGTAHAPTSNPFVITYKDFETPFGNLPCEREILRAIEAGAGSDLLEDEFVHRGEHSIEFQAIFLAYLFQEQKNISIVPILCGSFHEMVAARSQPRENRQVEDFIAATKAAVAGCGKKVCFIAGADLAHVGPRFGDQHQISDGFLRLLEADDLRMLEPLEEADASRIFGNIQADGDRRKICGLPPIYTMLSVMEAESGELLKYQQWPDPDGTVTFASMAFY